MDESTYWSLIDTLGGVANDRTVVRLEQELAARSAEDRDSFEQYTAELAQTLLSRCTVPPTHEGDTAEWMACAVVAAGQATYDRTKLAGGELDPDVWAWGEAEALLVVGFREEREGSPLGLTWLARQTPDDVAQPPAEPLPGTDEDDLAFGFEPFEDQEWRLAQTNVEGDLDLLRRIHRLGAASLQIAVADVDRPELVVEAKARRARLKVPVDSVVSAKMGRSAVYVEAVTALVQALEPDFGGV